MGFIRQSEFGDSVCGRRFRRGPCSRAGLSTSELEGFLSLRQEPAGSFHWT
jgi:hypothetical protein